MPVEYKYADAENSVDFLRSIRRSCRHKLTLDLVVGDDLSITPSESCVIEEIQRDDLRTYIVCTFSTPNHLDECVEYTFMNGSYILVRV